MMFPTIWYPKGLLKRILEVTLTPQGAYSGFQVTGMIEWSQKSRPQKNPRASSKSQKNPWTKNADYCITRAMESDTIINY